MGRPSIREVVAGNIRRLLVIRGMTVVALVSFAGTFPGHLQSVMASEKAATIDWLAKVAVALGLTVSDLVGE